MVYDFASSDNLLDIETICMKLCISRSTFERLRKPQQPHRSSVEVARRLVGDPSDDYSGMPPFPEPELTLGRSPRWSVSSLNKWIAARPSGPARILGK